MADCHGEVPVAFFRIFDLGVAINGHPQVEWGRGTDISTCAFLFSSPPPPPFLRLPREIVFAVATSIFSFFKCERLLMLSLVFFFFSFFVSFRAA